MIALIARFFPMLEWIKFGFLAGIYTGLTAGTLVGSSVGFTAAMLINKKTKRTISAK